MLDLRFVRENPEIVKQNIRNKFQDAKLPLVDEVIELDEENRKVKKEADDLRASRNKISKQIGALMGQGKMPTTSQVNPEEAKAHFTEYLKENKEILCIAFSSGLSGTYNSMRIAADEIMELLLAVNRCGNTVLLVTHERRYADLCGRKIEISDGKI